MSEHPSTVEQREETPVDDVRRVRERLSRDAGGDVHRLVEESRRAVERLRHALGLRSAPPPEG
jgi:hypothetical protein